MVMDHTANKGRWPGKTMLLVTSVLLTVMGGLSALLGLFLGLIGMRGGEWSGLVAPVAALLIVGALWNLAQGIAGIAASRRAGRGMGCTAMGILSLLGPALLLILAVIRSGETPPEDNVIYISLLLPGMILSALYLTAAIQNRRSGRCPEQPSP